MLDWVAARCLNPFDEEDIAFMEGHHVLFEEETDEFLQRNGVALNSFGDVCKLNYGDNLFGTVGGFKYPALPKVEEIPESDDTSTVASSREHKSVSQRRFCCGSKAVQKEIFSPDNEILVWDEQRPVFLNTNIKCIDPPVFVDTFAFDSKVVPLGRNFKKVITGTDMTFWSKGVEALWKTYERHNGCIEFQAALVEKLKDTKGLGPKEILRFLLGENDYVQAHHLLESVGAFDRYTWTQLLKLGGDAKVTNITAKSNMKGVASTLRTNLTRKLGEHAYNSLCLAKKENQTTFKKIGADLITSCGVVAVSGPNLGVSLDKINLLVTYKDELYVFDPRHCTLAPYSKKEGTPRSTRGLFSVTYGGNREGLNEYMIFDTTNADPDAVKEKKRKTVLRNQRQTASPFKDQIKAQMKKLAPSRKSVKTQKEMKPIKMDEVVYDRMKHIFEMRKVYEESISGTARGDLTAPRGELSASPGDLSSTRGDLGDFTTKRGELSAPTMGDLLLDLSSVRGEDVSSTREAFKSELVSVASHFSSY